jgi:thioredoxin-like negative regulator of GroEL
LARRLAAAGLAAIALHAPALHAASLPSTNVAWLAAAADADIDRAFARARAEGKPVLLYWGATWCPPCNQLKATLFNRQDFAALSRHFVAVHVDGDRPAAQKLGQRFKVSGYPTVVLFNPQGQEITRLPGDVDAQQLMSVLELGLAGGRPIKAVLDDALAGKPLSANEWRMLAFYSWETDEAQLVPKAELPALLARLAVAGNAAGVAGATAAASGGADGEIATRLWLKALAASDDGQGVKADDALRQRVQRVLADPALARSMSGALVAGATDIVRTLEDDDSPRRAPLVASYDAALARLQNDGTLSRGDRMDALIARVDLARLGQPKEETKPKLPQPLVAEVREAAARADREITDGYERQAVITSAAHLLGQAGLWDESDALLKANLAKSHSPYYLMSQLGSNARKLGKKDEALRWYAEAFEKSQGPATRLQWGSGYLVALIELAPQDAGRIEKVASRLLREAAADAGAFEGRSARSLQRMGSRLVGWNGDGKHGPSLKRLQAQLDGICPKVEAADRAACRGLLEPARAAAAKKGA